MFTINGIFSDLPTTLMTIPIVLIALTVHEVAHGWMAYKLGDPTAKNLGRLTLNPLKHLDPIGALCMLLFRFGWARPVPINPRYFKKNRRDTALTALAGPLSNLILAFAGVLIHSVVRTLCFENLVRGYIDVTYAKSFPYLLLTASMTFIELFVLLNVSLAVFNLIPVPPLDGSRIFLVFLPPRIYFGIMQYERYIQLGLMLLLFTNVLNGYLSMGVSAIVSGMEWIVGLIPFLK